MANPDLQIRRGGGGGSSIKKKNFFGPSGLRKNKGGGPPLDPPLKSVRVRVDGAWPADVHVQTAPYSFYSRSIHFSSFYRHSLAALGIFLIFLMYCFSIETRSNF